MKEHNYAFQNTDTRPRLQSRTQNICFVKSSFRGGTSGARRRENVDSLLTLIEWLLYSV